MTTTLNRTPVTLRERHPTGGAAELVFDDALRACAGWPPPTCIVADGPYGLGKFPGDPPTPDALADWYEPHIAVWSARALPETTLWFWCTEVGWAEVHPVLKRHGWRNAATRKYFTQCHLWYFPPPDKMMQLVDYAARHGRPTARPYFSLDGRTPLSAAAWVRMRAKWSHSHGVTNVWTEPAVRGSERLKADRGLKALHANQKPLRLLERIVLACTDPGDVLWEPFAGLAGTLVVALRHQRRGFAAEINPAYFRAASERLRLALRAPATDLPGLGAPHPRPEPTTSQPAWFTAERSSPAPGR